MTDPRPKRAAWDPTTAARRESPQARAGISEGPGPG